MKLDILLITGSLQFKPLLNKINANVNLAVGYILKERNILYDMVGGFILIVMTYNKSIVDIPLVLIYHSDSHVYSLLALSQSAAELSLQLGFPWDSPCCQYRIYNEQT